ncbi:MAG: hypothetical protein ACI86H_001426 [bacterium]|jgi:uncharacterized protein
MIINLYELKKESKNLTFTIPKESCQRAEDESSILGDGIECNAKVSLFDDQVSVKGNYSCRIEKACDLCLEKTVLKFSDSVQVRLVPNQMSQDLGDQEVKMSDDEIIFYEGDSIYLDKVFEDQLLLDMPYSFICSDNCQGICSGCKKNLNHEKCQCDADVSTNPFAVLKDFSPSKKD